MCHASYLSLAADCHDSTSTWTLTEVSKLKRGIQHKRPGIQHAVNGERLRVPRLVARSRHDNLIPGYPVRILHDGDGVVAGVDRGW